MASFPLLSMLPAALNPSFETRPEPRALLILGVSVFAALFTMEVVMYRVMCLLNALLGGKGAILGPERNRVILGRRCTEAMAMGVFGYLGLQMQNELGWGEGSLWGGAEGGSVEANGAAAAARTHLYHGGAFRLALFQLAYQCFNMLTSLRDNDGALFVAHHIVTGGLCFFLLDSFCVIYCPFFLGVTEVSTAVLCALASFDDALGVPALAARFPTLKMLLATVFAGVFIWCRIYWWYFLSIAFWKDMLALLADPNTAGKLFHGTVPQPAFIVSFLVCNAGLSLLQVVWLGEIFVVAHKELLGGGGASMSSKAASAKTKKGQ